MTRFPSDVLTPEILETSLSATGWVYGTQVPEMQDRTTAPHPKREKSRAVSDERMEDSLRYLAITDELSAELKANVARREYAAKLARARMMLLSTETTVEARKADAERSHDVQKAEDAIADAMEAYEKVRAKRQTEELVIEVWRTTQANRRHGNL